MSGYDKSTPEGILKHARLLLGKSLRVLHSEVCLLNTGKGGLGQSVEKYHFEYQPNSESEPDFKEAGVELKCTPLKVIEDGSMLSKERLVLNIINYLEECNKSFETSSFIHKNSLLLLMFYLYEKDVNNIDFIFKIIRLWKIPEEDFKIFMDDWMVIHNKIIHGHAHEISEGDTLYLAACVKGSKSGAEKRQQPNSSILAQQRAYSIKSSYLNFIILDSLSHPEMISGLKITDKTIKKLLSKRSGSIIKSIRDYKSGETFEQIVISRFGPFIGKSIAMIENELNTKVSKSPKAISYSVCRAILGIKEKSITEFEKANIILKTIRLEPNGTLKESMSFKNINYKDIVNEDKWTDSEWYNIIASHKFLFIVFRKNENGNDDDAIFDDAFFWNMPQSDIEKVAVFWKDTRDKIKKGDYEHFIKLSEHPICHVRPKGRNSQDLTPTPQGGMAKKYCYWLNSNYILNIINNYKQYKLYNLKSKLL